MGENIYRWEISLNKNNMLCVKRTMITEVKIPNDECSGSENEY